MIVKSDFESRICRCDVYKIARFDDLETLSHELENKHCHIITKVDDQRTDIINFLLENNFLYSASTTFLQCSIEDETFPPTSTIREITLQDLETLYAICDNAFAHGNRYANDRFLKTYNRSIHRHWIANSIDFYADYNCGILSGDVLAGFATLHIQADSSSIGLLAVEHRFRKQGLGSKLIHRLREETISRNLNRITVATESNNFPALSLYTRNGFTIYNSQLSLYRPAHH